MSSGTDSHTSFKWANLASNKAGVTVIIVGISNRAGKIRRIYYESAGSENTVKEVDNINPYLVPGENTYISKSSLPFNELPRMNFGNKPVDGGHLLMTSDELASLGLTMAQKKRFIKRNYGGAEFIRGIERYCLWINDADLADALAIPGIADRIEAVREMRLASPDSGANEMASRAHQMREMLVGRHHAIVVAAISSENRPYLPCGLIDNQTTINNKNYAIYDAPLWSMAIVASRLHWVWIGTVCVRMRTDFSYSNTLGWNTFPIPSLTEKNKADLTRCAEDILLAREAHFPATIADLYDPTKMPADLRETHERNDEVLERIYIGRRFRNDTERLEKLFEFYTKMAASAGTNRKRKAGATA